MEVLVLGEQSAAALRSGVFLRNVGVCCVVGGVCGILLAFCFFDFLKIEKGVRDLTCDLSPPLDFGAVLGDAVR